MMAQPVMAQPVMAQPVMSQPMAVGQPMVGVQPMGVQPMPPVVVHHHMAADPTAPPPGAPAGGFWKVEPFCGDNTIIATVVTAIFFPYALCCIPCCKCDQRRVYQGPGGELYLPNGAQAPPDCCPCG